MKIWILFVCAVAVGVSAQSDEAAFPDYWEDDYNDQWYQVELEKLGILDAPSNENKDAPEDKNNINYYDDNAKVGSQEKALDEMDQKVQEDIQKFKQNEFEADADETVKDYQIEDNRSDAEENVEDIVDNNKKSSEKAVLIRDVDDVHNEDNVSANDYGEYADYDPLDEKPKDDTLPNVDEENEQVEFSKDDVVESLPMPPQLDDEIQQMIEETKAILSEEEQQPNDEIQQMIEETKAILSEEEQQPNDFVQEESKEDLNNIMDTLAETKNILEETNDQFEETLDKSNQLDKPEEDIPKKINDENIDDEIEKKIDENFSENIVEKDDDSIDKVYEDLNDDLDTLFETLKKLANSEETADKVELDVDYAVNSDESLDDKADYENVFDSNLSELFSQHSKSENDDAKPVENENKEAEKQEESSSSDDESVNGEENKPVPYVNDALVSTDIEEAPIKSVGVDELTDDQLVKLMEDFAVQHSDALNVEPSSDNHIVNEIDLEYGDVLVIETENYPAGYPTNRIVDWIITGKGVGIEFNVTDFAVNSALGDYLLVKPGQADDSGPDGIIFSYHLNNPRPYRFMDVDRLFLRFDAKNGFSFLRGFNLTVAMIAPLPSEPEPIPEPAPVLPEPQSPLSIVLGGLTLQEFTAIREDFRLLVADMATMYINANRIEPGLNTTAEITQIISASVCNVHWPGFEQCAHVRVAVPLVYEESEGEARLNERDLEDMWNTYVDQDPFAARLRQMGIEEFSVPNDGGVLTVWLVVALGVLVSAAMLAFALWRYTCFKDYSRMPAFSDTDSLNEKRGLDLYPTPHQTLPPLYSESEYKWDKYEDSTRVDMGGYANRSYVRSDNMYDLDSDEDAAPRDRNAGIQPRDIHAV